MTSAWRVPEGVTENSACEAAGRLVIAVADAGVRREIYRLRHEIFATELGQHAETLHGTFSDRIDDFNIYIAARQGGVIAGFVSVTRPGHGYSFEKYLAREQLPFALDEGLYEIRLLRLRPGRVPRGAIKG